uniref:Uncharacterized protein n=1 Tax=Setaria viridis TaxID=4556 RepID=A0A4U6U9A2_SETVI|nr:hypothetical protein SEVIR_5G033200v2 [Setaria viridis]
MRDFDADWIDSFQKPEPVYPSPDAMQNHPTRGAIRVARHCLPTSPFSANHLGNSNLKVGCLCLYSVFTSSSVFFFFLAMLRNQNGCTVHLCQMN